MKKYLKIALFISLGLVITLASGCATKPWVKPYEREILAKPIMLFSRDSFADIYMDHVHEVREGAQGGGVGAGGGCGCN
ncbi:Phosphonate ABC transporter phosphate-binding periplasmic component (TC 3.A.1.9.1) [hydrothermal vent metagenome]|uniref:Phosphonate ABC transporter phosphate-binding periplasmic component (TC 3.A.1.9.1) n=1 Tax=hydrothermal vent metagenome TaxID=652676 RepID=A0A3B1AA23_9ZZZZ